MKNELNQDEIIIQDKLKAEASSFEIKKSASDILQAYKCRQVNKASEKESIVKIPVYKKTWFKLAASFSVAGIIVGSSLGIYYGTRGTSSTPFFSAPILTTTSEKLIFETNNAAGLLTNALAVSSNSKIKPLFSDDDSDSDDDDQEDSDESSEDEKNNVTSSQLNDIATTYHKLFNLLEKSSNEDGTFIENDDVNKGRKYKYYSSKYNYVLSTDSDPSILSGDFTADLSFSNSLYSLAGKEENDCLSLTISQAGNTVMTLKEEKNSLKVKRSKYSFEMTYQNVKDVIYYDSDFSSDDDDAQKEKDIEIGLTRYVDGVKSAYYYYDSEFQTDRAEIEYTYQKDGFDISGDIDQQISGEKSIFYFEDYEYKVTI